MTTRIHHVEYPFDAASLASGVRHVGLREALGTPFEAGLQLLCDADILTAELAGADATLTMTRRRRVPHLPRRDTRAEVRVRGHGTIALVRFKSPLVRLDRGHDHRTFEGVAPLEPGRSTSCGGLGEDYSARMPSPIPHHPKA